MNPKLTSIETEYAHLLPRVRALDSLLNGYPDNNDSAEGVVRGILKFLEREIVAKRVPIPLDPSYYQSLKNAIGSAELDHVDGSYLLLVQIKFILSGEGVVSESDYPVVVSRINEFVVKLKSAAAKRGQPVDSSPLLLKLSEVSAALISRKLKLPLDAGFFRSYQADSLFWDRVSSDDRLNQEFLELSPILLEGKSPRPDRPLRFPAPVPGLPQKAGNTRTF